MSFLWPVMLILLVFVPLAVVIYLWRQRRRQRGIPGYGRLGLLQGGIAHRLGFLRHLAPPLFLLALTLLITAMVRPRPAARRLLDRKARASLPSSSCSRAAKTTKRLIRSR